jgi:hypothetical protein
LGPDIQKEFSFRHAKQCLKEDKVVLPFFLHFIFCVQLFDAFLENNNKKKIVAIYKLVHGLKQNWVVDLLYIFFMGEEK